MLTDILKGNVDSIPRGTFTSDDFTVGGHENIQVMTSTSEGPMLNAKDVVDKIKVDTNYTKG